MYPSLVGFAKHLIEKFLRLVYSILPVPLNILSPWKIKFTKNCKSPAGICATYKVTEDKKMTHTKTVGVTPPPVNETGNVQKAFTVYKST